MADTYGKIVKEIPLTPSTKLCIKSGAELGGKKFFDIRKYVMTAKYTGPTKDGLFLPQAVCKELGMALLAIAEIEAQAEVRPQ
jgi:hypothetical protein